MFFQRAIINNMLLYWVFMINACIIVVYNSELEYILKVMKKKPNTSHHGNSSLLGQDNGLMEMSI